MNTLGFVVWVCVGALAGCEFYFRRGRHLAPSLSPCLYGRLAFRCGRVDFIFNKGFARVTFSHLESRGDLGVDGVGRRGDFIAAVLPEFRGVGFAGGLNVWLIRLHGKWV